jgi:RNA polymerase sigma-70 factor (ECF subfamily)
MDEHEPGNNVPMTTSTVAEPIDSVTSVESMHQIDAVSQLDSVDPAVPPAPTPKASSGLFKRNPPIAGEAEAIEAAKNGDPDAFSKLYALHKRRVYTLCLRMLGNVSEAEDMTQEAFLHLFRKLGSFRGESAFSTWLHRLTVNLVLMHLRKKGLNLVSLEETISPSEEDAPKRDFGSRDPMLAGSVDRVALERAVASLPPGYRMVFVLHDVEGFEHNEIATMLECSTGNSKSQLHKARLKLRELLRLQSQTVPALKEASA